MASCTVSLSGNERAKRCTGEAIQKTKGMRRFLLLYIFGHLIASARQKIRVLLITVLLWGTTFLHPCLYTVVKRVPRHLTCVARCYEKSGAGAIIYSRHCSAGNSGPEGTKTCEYQQPLSFGAASMRRTVYLVNINSSFGEPFRAP